MRTPALALTVLALLALAPALAASAASPPRVTFQPPAQAGPGLDVAGATWVLLVFGDSSLGGFEVAFPGGAQHTNVTVQRAGIGGAVEAHPDPETVESPAQPMAALTARAAVGGPGSLYLEGDTITVETEGAAGDVVQGGCADALLADPERVGHEARYRDLCPSEPGVAAVARGASVRIEARGLRTVEWHHLGVACDAGGCPDGGVRKTQESGPVELQVLGYHRFATSDGSAKGSAAGAVVLAGGDSLDLLSHGRVRLPDARGGVLDGRTLQADGDVGLLGLHATDDGRMEAQLSGNAAAARLDEDGIDPVALGLGAAGAVAAAGLLALLAKAALASFTRLTPQRSLESRRRQALMDAIQAHPGIHERALARLTGQAPGTVRHHVAVLVAQGLATRTRHGKVVRLHDARPGPRGDPSAAALLDPGLRRLDEWRRGHPQASATEAVRHAVAAWGWSRSTAYHRLARLDAALLGRS